MNANVFRTLVTGGKTEDMVRAIMSAMSTNDSKALGVVHGFTGINDPSVHQQDMYQSGRLMGARYLDAYNAQKNGGDKNA